MEFYRSGVIIIMKVRSQKAKRHVGQQRYLGKGNFSLVLKKMIPSRVA